MTRSSIMKKIWIIETREETGKIELVLEQLDGPQQGKFHLVFRSDPMQLYQIILVNESEQETIFTLDRVKENITIPDSRFVFENPRGLQDPTKKR